VPPVTRMSGDAMVAAPCHIGGVWWVTSMTPGAERM
jgi:hypothetical protein